MNNNDKYLPVGTVCLLKNATKKIMITGFLIKNNLDGNMYDYIGCLYPEGVITSNKTLLFNHEQIERVLYKGYVNEDEIDVKKELAQITNQNLDSKTVDSLASNNDIDTRQEQ